jgi:hypothetical protein
MGSWVISGQPIGRYALRHVLAKRKLQSGSVISASLFPRGPNRFTLRSMHLCFRNDVDDIDWCVRNPRHKLEVVGQ